jgi:hypothetical protein
LEIKVNKEFSIIQKKQQNCNKNNIIKLDNHKLLLNFYSRNLELNTYTNLSPELTFEFEYKEMDKDLIYIAKNKNKNYEITYE